MEASAEVVEAAGAVAAAGRRLYCEHSTGRSKKDESSIFEQKFLETVSHC